MNSESNPPTACWNCVTCLWHNASSMLVNCKWPQFSPDFSTRPEEDRSSQKVGPKTVCSQNMVFHARFKRDANAGLRPRPDKRCTCVEQITMVASCGLWSSRMRLLCLALLHWCTCIMRGHESKKFWKPKHCYELLQGCVRIQLEHESLLSDNQGLP